METKVKTLHVNRVLRIKGAREMNTLLERFAESHKIELEHHLIWTVSVAPVLVVLGCLTPGANTARYSMPFPIKATFPANKWPFKDLMWDAFRVVFWRPIHRSDKLMFLMLIHDLTDTHSVSPSSPEKNVVVLNCLQNYSFYTYGYGGNCSDGCRVSLLSGLYARSRKEPRRRPTSCQINTQTRRTEIPRIYQINKKSTSRLQSWYNKTVI